MYIHPGQFRLSFSLNHAQKFPSITLVKKRMVCQKIQGIDVFFLHIPACEIQQLTCNAL